MSARRGAPATWNPDMSYVDDITLVITVPSTHSDALFLFPIAFFFGNFDDCTQMRKMEGTSRNLARVATGCVFLPRAPHRCSPKFPSHSCRSRWPRLAFYLPRLQKVVRTALLILLDANRSWRDVLRHDCLSMWLQATFVNQVLPHLDGPMLQSWCDFAATSTRRWKHMVKAWARSHVPQAAWDEDSPQPCGVPLHTDVQLRWPCYECVLFFGSHRALMAHSTAAHAAVSFASRFVFDEYFPCCLTLFHTRQRVHEHLVDGKRRCLQALAASVEPASDALVQQLLDQDKRVRRASKHLSLEWRPKHLPAIRMRGPVQSWAHRLGRWSSA